MKMILNLIFIVLICFSNYQFVENFNCYDELGPQYDGDVTPKEVPTDFSLVYKQPKSSLDNGYFYKTFLDASNEFQFSKRYLFKDRNSIFSLIHKQLYYIRNLNKISYIAYSEKLKAVWKLSPKKKIGKVGKGSGYLIWNHEKQSAVWIVYSNNKNMYPRFPDYTKDWSVEGVPEQRYPLYIEKGAMFLCLQIRYEDISTILMHLVIKKSSIYDYYMSDNTKDFEMTDYAINSIYTDPKQLKMNPQSIQKNQISDLKTVNGLKYKIITYSFKDKGGFWNFVANKLKCKKIYIKSYDKLKRASVSKSVSFKPSCRNRLINIENITMNVVINDIRYSRQWNYKRDRSKYGICESESGPNYICISDLDRNPDYFRETGSVVCLEHGPLYQSFKSIKFDYNCI